MPSVRSRRQASQSIAVDQIPIALHMAQQPPDFRQDYNRRRLCENGKGGASNPQSPKPCGRIRPPLNADFVVRRGAACTSLQHFAVADAERQDIVAARHSAINITLDFPRAWQQFLETVYGVAADMRVRTSRK